MLWLRNTISRTLFSLIIRTPQRLTLLFLKFEQSTIRCLKIAGCVANSVDPDETPPSAASHQGLQCLIRRVCLNKYGKYSSRVYVMYDNLIYINFCVPYSLQITSLPLLPFVL